MPFKSEAQRGYLFVHNPKVAKEFAKATPKGKKLPYHVKKQKKSANHHKAVMKGLSGY